MFFEFQLSTSTLGPLVRNQLHNLTLCFPGSFPFKDETLLVNRILVPENTVLQRQTSTFTVYTSAGQTTVAGSKCVLVQPLQLELVREKDAITSGASEAPINMTPTVNVWIDITAFVTGSEAFLQFAFNKIDYGLLGIVIPQKTQETIGAAVQGSFGTIKRKVDMDALQGLTQGVALTATNAGVTTTSDGAVLILRVEINGTANQTGHWTDFYNTYDTNLTGDRNWALLVDKDLLVTAINAKLGSSLAASSDKFSLDSGPSTSWKQGKPGFDVSFSGEVIDACTCFWGEIDLDVDVSSSVKLSVPSKNVFRMRVHTTYDASDLETFCCALTAGLFWPVVGLIYLGKEKINFGKYLLGWLVTPIGVFIAVCIVAGNQSIADQMGGLGGDCKKIDDETIQCDQNLSFTFGALGGTYNLEAITGTLQGPVLSGTAVAIQALKSPKLKVGAVNEFHWTLEGSCSSGFHAAAVGGFSYSNAVPGSMLKVCGVEVLEDPANAFLTKYDNYSVTIHPLLTTEYLAAPYPCRLRLTTNGGVRIISLSVAKEATPEELQKVMVMQGVAKSNCYIQLPKVPDEIRYIHWLVDPSPEITVHGLWHIVVSEMDPAERIELVDAQGKTIATATASGRGVAHATVLQEQLQADVGLRFAAALRAGARDELKRHVSVRQVEMMLAARFWVGPQFDGLELERTQDQMVLRLRSSGAEAVYEVSVPEAPALIASRLLQGAPAAPASLRSRVVASSAAAARSGLVPRRDQFALSEDRTQLMVHLPAGNVERVQLQALSDGPVLRIAPATVPGRKYTVALLLGSGGVQVLDVSDPKHAQEVTRYNGKPWFVDSARSGSLVARLSDDGQWVNLYRVGRTLEPSVEELTS